MREHKKKYEINYILEFSDIPLSSPFSYVFFLVFVFLIVVVLMNLLNGLAVREFVKYIFVFLVDMFFSFFATSFQVN